MSKLCEELLLLNKKNSPVNKMGKILEQRFIKDLGMTQKLLKSCSPPIVIREMPTRRSDTKCRPEDGVVSRWEAHPPRSLFPSHADSGDRVVIVPPARCVTSARGPDALARRRWPRV